ncbi:DUF6230 family protein [Streptomyces sp. NPDC016845]|uniref:DUF6230 family protein n=1 Tax=Streptomyces sp. NPDC016845 TaxID=3364972 RepID=UPI0037B11DF2
MTSVARGGTRWKRFAVVMVPSVAATAAIGVALSQGALAASFSVSGQSFKVHVDKLDARGMVQYGAIDAEANGTVHPVSVSAFKKADLTNMCQSVVTHLPGLGDITLVLKAGGGGTPAHADNIYIDVAQLKADAEFRDINIGVAAGESTKGPGMKGGKEQADKNGFAQEARRAILTDVDQTAWATSAGTFKLNGLNMSLKKGSGKGIECY